MENNVETELLSAVRLSAERYIRAGKVVEVGLSGGLDSVVLLHLLNRLKQDCAFSLCAIHVHHGLNQQADAWAEFCRDLCLKLDIPFRLAKVSVNSSGLGVEAAARKERYRIFSDGPANIMALAHHADDQVETFMLAAVRGGGIRALAAMPEWRKLDELKNIWRPLLKFSRDQLSCYAETCGLLHVEDLSNNDVDFLRNWFRHEILPKYSERVPHYKQQVLANVSSLQADLAMIDEVVAADWQDVYYEGRFDVSRWKKLSQMRKQHQLVHFSKLTGLGVPNRKSIECFATILEQASSAEWSLPLGRAYLYGGYLFPVKDKFEQHYSWLSTGNSLRGRLKNNLVEFGIGLIRHDYGLSEDSVAAVAQVRAVVPGDTLLLACGRKSVRKILQEHHVPPFIRSLWPVLVNIENQCMAVVNIQVSVDHGCRDGLLPIFYEFNQYILEPK